MLIEMLGPSGVGKSTVMLEAAGRSRVESSWIAGSLFEKPFRTTTTEWRNNAFDAPKMQDFAIRSLDSLSDTRMRPSHRVAVSNMLRNSAARRAYILGAHEELPVVAEELLLHRGLSFLPFSRHLRGRTDDYYSSVPLPDAAIILDAPTDDTVGRARARGDTVSIYRGLGDRATCEIVDNAREVSLMAFEVLTGRGLPVLLLDTSRPVAETAAKLNEWIGRRS